MEILSKKKRLPHWWCSNCQKITNGIHYKLTTILIKKYSSSKLGFLQIKVHMKNLLSCALHIYYNYFSVYLKCSLFANNWSFFILWLSCFIIVVLFFILFLFLFFSGFFFVSFSLSFYFLFTFKSELFCSRSVYYLCVSYLGF